MDWNGYTIFSVITGMVCIIFGALAKDLEAKHRAWSVVAGLAFVAYGIFVATQRSGTWFFPVWIFVLPFLLIGYLILAARKRKQQK